MCGDRGFEVWPSAGRQRKCRTLIANAAIPVVRDEQPDSFKGGYPISYSRGYCWVSGAFASPRGDFGSGGGTVGAGFLTMKERQERTGRGVSDIKLET